MRVAGVVLALVASSLHASATARTADATYPGRNGRIAFERESRPCRLAAGDLICKHAIWTANLDGSDEKRLTSAADASQPTWSPNGRKIAYLQFVGSKALMDVWVMNADGSANHKLRRIDKPLSYVQGSDGAVVPRWSQDGKTILVGGSKFTKDKPPKGYSIAAKGAVIAVPTSGAAPRILFLTRGRSVTNPQFSPSGKLIAFVVPGVQHGVLYVSRRDGSRLRSLATADGDFDWSPDGRRIVFWRRTLDSQRDVYDPQLHVIDVDGSGLRRLTTEPTYAETVGEAPQWSPDGKAIIFKSGTGFDEDGLPDPRGEVVDHRFAVINPDGSNLHLVGPEARDCTVGTYRHVCRAVAPTWQPS